MTSYVRTRHSAQIYLTCSAFADSNVGLRQHTMSQSRFFSGSECIYFPVQIRPILGELNGRRRERCDSKLPCSNHSHDELSM
jgi:hypothetical protein